MLSVLKSIRLLHIIDNEIDHMYDLFPSEILCERIHYSNFDNAWDDYKSFRPNLIIIHLISKQKKCDHLTDLISSNNAKCPILLLTDKSLYDSYDHPLCRHVTKIIFFPVTIPQLEKNIQEILQEKPLIYDINTELIFDPTNSVLIHRASGRIHLTAKENKLLTCLINNGERIVSYLEIANCVWYEEQMNRNTLTTIISNIKKKIGDEGIIKNYSSQGYKLHLDSK